MAASSSGAIKKLEPRACVEGGEVYITCEGYDTSDYKACQVLLGSQHGRIVSASPERVIIAAPEYPIGIEGDEVSLEGASTILRAPLTLGRKIADSLHPVANPAVDRDDGTIYVTLSGSRGQKVPVSIYKIDTDDTVSPFIADDLMNPTGLAFNREGTLFVTSRYDGTLYSISPFKELQTVATDLGVATGIAFNERGEIFIGDRSGTILRVNELGEARPFADLEASVSAFHLAFSPDGNLYVTGPTVSSYESVHRIDALGEVTTFYRGLGRPQGLAFDEDGNLYVAASLRGHRGIVRIPPSGEDAEVVVSGSSLVGLAFDDRGHMIVAGTQSVYRVPMDVRGYHVF